MKETTKLRNIHLVFEVSGDEKGAILMKMMIRPIQTSRLLYIHLIAVAVAITVLILTNRPIRLVVRLAYVLVLTCCCVSSSKSGKMAFYTVYLVLVKANSKPKRLINFFLLKL